MTKQKIKFRCRHTYPRYEFETNEWYTVYDFNEDGCTYVRLSAICDSCGKTVYKDVSLSEIFEILMTVPE